jgi:hypothetical protein
LFSRFLIFEPDIEYQVPEGALEIIPDKNIVVIMKFCLSALSCLQVVLMCFQFKIISAILREEERLDLNLQERGGNESLETKNVSLDLVQGPRFCLKYGFNAATFRILVFVVELMLCLVHPAPYIKRKVAMSVVGRMCIYSIESWVLQAHTLAPYLLS